MWEYTRVILLKLQLSKSRNGCLGVPEVKRAKEVTYKKQFSIPWYVDIQLLTISRGEVFVIPFGRKRRHDVTENVSRDLIPNNNLQSIKFEFITSRKQLTKAKITAINHYLPCQRPAPELYLGLLNHKMHF